MEFVAVRFETDFGRDLETVLGTLLAKRRVNVANIINSSDLKNISNTKFESRIRTLFEKSSRERAVFFGKYLSMA